MKIAFVDRDGTIIKDYQDEEWGNVSEPEFLDGSLEALKRIKEKGYQIIIVTNQYLINDEIITLSQYRAFTEKTIQIVNDYGVEILDVFHCPHSKTEDCNCFKPKIGLIEMALEKYQDIELDKSLMVGDSLCDVELGNKVGIITFGINVNSKLFDYVSLKSLLDIVKYL